MNEVESPTPNERGLWLKYAAALLVALTAVWYVGLFDRGYWRPDEPREAALVLSMVDNPGRALPALAGQPFTEKPPLTYWLAAASVGYFGASPAAVRAPQMLFAYIALIAFIALAHTIGGSALALVAAWVFATSALVYQTQMWLRVDALLIAGVSVALLGMYCGLSALQTLSRFRWYLLMYLGLTVAFFAKNFAAWLVPVSAFVTYVLWERRLRELLRWELWIGVAIPVTAITVWIASLMAESDGYSHLQELFWSNLAGRAMPIAVHDSYSYSSGHRNWPGKYFVELFVYLIPWSVVAIAAFVRAWRMSRIESSRRSAWRFGLCASLPGLVVLSIAATSRGVYAAPTLFGISILVGLWATDHEIVSKPSLNRVLVWTGVLIALISGLLLVLTLVLLLDLQQRSWTGLVSVAATFASCVAAGAVALSRGARLPVVALHRLGLAYALTLSLGMLSVFDAINRWQDLPKLASEIRYALGQRSLVLWHPDETTLAWVSLYVPRPPERIFYEVEGRSREDLNDLKSYLAIRPNARVLALAPRRRWQLKTWLEFLRLGSSKQMLATSSGADRWWSKAALEALYFVEQPGGRGYVLLGNKFLEQPRTGGSNSAK